MLPNERTGREIEREDINGTLTPAPARLFLLLLSPLYYTRYTDITM
jgi:hypothetical protein